MGNTNFFPLCATISRYYIYFCYLYATKQTLAYRDFSVNIAFNVYIVNAKETAANTAVFHHRKGNGGYLIAEMTLKGVLQQDMQFIVTLIEYD
jgi:hypothetical protein